ncbi:MAG: CheR family methyltransferase [Pseudanabaenaceae cyanobacterium bins.39]|nr:CheR family methyltransferase [Pseudanabaenaceae cyanobacterium bins.39]
MVTIPQSVLEKLKAAIAEHFGIYIRSQDDANFCKKIHSRVQALKLSTYESYYDLLSSPSDLSQSEWRELIRQVTISETYFMRDKGHINLLQNNILPELIQAQDASKTLRIWSAGCSTGEEAYSLAILLYELIPNPQNWRLHIVGSDLNPEVVQKAKQAIYSDWSLRSLTSEQKRRYFTQQASLWRLNENLCKMVTFYSNNLIDDTYSAYAVDFSNFDLILCRNVFIYFEPKAIKKVLRRFQMALKSNGYLITGHMELHGQSLDGFKVNVFPDAVVYRKMHGNASANGANSPDYRSYSPSGNSSQSHSFQNPQQNLSANASNALLAPELSSATWESYRHASQNITDRLANNEPAPRSSEVKTDWDRLTAAENAIGRTEYHEALQYLEEIQEKRFHFLKIHQLSALIYANLGELKSAYAHCEEAIKLEPNLPKVYYLMAHIADEMGKYDEVKKLLKKAIYLDLYYVAAYLALGDMYGRESDRDRALKMYRSTIDILKALPSNTIVPETDLTPIELIPQVEERMRWIGVGFSL